MSIPSSDQVYKLYSELISTTIAEGGPYAARSTYVKYMRSVKKVGRFMLISAPQCFLSLIRCVGGFMLISAPQCFLSLSIRCVAWVPIVRPRGGQASMPWCSNSTNMTHQQIWNGISEGAHQQQAFPFIHSTLTRQPLSTLLLSPDCARADRDFQ